MQTLLLFHCLPTVVHFQLHDIQHSTILNKWTVSFVCFLFQMEDVSVHKLDKESLTVPSVQMLGDDAVLAFSAFACVQLPTAVGPSHPCVVVLMDELLVAEVAQLDGPGDRLAQKVTFVL